MDTMSEARTLAAEMTEDALAHITPDAIPDLWENVDLETEGWDKLKSLCMFGEVLDTEGFRLSASSRAGFMLGMEIGRKLTERALTPFITIPKAAKASALQERGALEERYGAYFKRIEAASEPEERKRLLFEMDDVVGERLALEGDHAEEFRTVDAEF